MKLITFAFKCAIAISLISLVVGAWPTSCEDCQSSGIQRPKEHTTHHKNYFCINKPNFEKAGCGDSGPSSHEAECSNIKKCVWLGHKQNTHRCLSYCGLCCATGVADKGDDGCIPIHLMADVTYDIKKKCRDWEAGREGRRKLK